MRRLLVVLSCGLALALGCAPAPRPSSGLPDIIREFPDPARPKAEPAPPEPSPTRRAPSTLAPTTAITPNTADVDGFGSGTVGGRGGRRIVVAEASEAAIRRAFSDANQHGGHAVIEFPAGKTVRIQTPLPKLTAPWITLEGHGTTLDGLSMTHEAALIDIRTHDVVVRDFRLRNGYDNLRIQEADAYSILVSHVSSTGAADDAISITQGAHDVTVQWSFLAGNTRSIFCKYLGTTRISIHHTWIQKGWIRNPLFQGPMLVDLRNVIVEDWGQWGVRFQDAATGNVVGSVFALSPAARNAGGKPDSALRLQESGAVHVEGNVFRDVVAGVGSSAEPIRVAPVPTQSAAAMEPQVRKGAGCMPRDKTDAAYIALTSGWTLDRRQPIRLGE